MKTAIIKTDFWKDDSIFELTPDVRMFYLCLLTNPERNTTRAFKCSDRLMSAYTGYNHDTIKLCRKKLQEAGLIRYEEDYYILKEDTNVEPKKGKLTQTIQEKYIESLPKNVVDILLNNESITTDKSSRVALEPPLEYIYIYKDNNKDNNNNIYNKEFKELNEFWSKLSNRKLSDNKTAREAFKKLRKEHEVEDIRQAIQGAVYYQGTKYKPQVMSFASMYGKWDSLIGHMVATKKEHDKPQEVF